MTFSSEWMFHSLRSDALTASACNCVGPQPGYPRCPCQMRGLIQRDGRWIEPEKDLGPVSPLISDRGDDA